MVLESKSARLSDLRIQAVTVQAQTAAKLREAIFSGLFKPGERLVESELCLRMGVSRTSIREALRQVSAERLVTIVPNRGPLVSQITWEEAREIYDVRALLEGEAVALFATQATPGSLTALRLALQDFEAATKTEDRLGRLAATERFYEIILNGCGNRIIAEILRGLLARITFLRAQSMSHPGRAQHSAREMRNILEAIETGDPRAARLASARHVQSACAAARIVFGVAAAPAVARKKGDGKRRRG